MAQLLETYSYTAEGYRPLVEFNSWRVAYLNYIHELDPAKITRVEKHIETDEVFVLLKGEAVLYIGEGTESLGKLTAQRLKPYTLYNVKMGTWHTIVLSLDATILLIENHDTGEKNSAYCALDHKQKEYIRSVAREELPKWWS